MIEMMNWEARLTRLDITNLKRRALPLWLPMVKYPLFGEKSMHSGIRMGGCDVDDEDDWVGPGPPPAFGIEGKFENTLIELKWIWIPQKIIKLLYII